jgi:hypothetical protein
MTNAGGRAAAAAGNNAAWCDTVCRAHGAPGEFHDGLCWVNRWETPPFYPNAVTLTGDPGAAPKLLALLRELEGAGLAGEWAVKDSFQTLDLAPLGYRPLFDASWIFRPASLPPPAGGGRWERVTEETELAAWEAAWHGENMPPPGAPRLFPPALLADPEVVFLAAREAGRVVAGAVANRAAGVVGLSNVFTPPGTDGAGWWGSLIADVAPWFPGVALVGYEAGDDLAAPRACGFETVGPLRVWVKESYAAAEPMG